MFVACLQNDQVLEATALAAAEEKVKRLEDDNRWMKSMLNEQATQRSSFDLVPSQPPTG